MIEHSSWTYNLLAQHHTFSNVFFLELVLRKERNCNKLVCVVGVCVIVNTYSNFWSLCFHKVQTELLHSWQATLKISQKIIWIQAKNQVGVLSPTPPPFPVLQNHNNLTYVKQLCCQAITKHIFGLDKTTYSKQVPTLADITSHLSISKQFMKVFHRCLSQKRVKKKKSIRCLNTKRDYLPSSCIKNVNKKESFWTVICFCVWTGMPNT